MKISSALFAFAAVTVAGASSAPTISEVEHAKNDTSARLAPGKNLRDSSGMKRRRLNCGGGNPGNGVCADSSLCCSQWGWCGKSANHCRGQSPPAKEGTTQSKPAPPPPPPSTTYSGAPPSGRKKCANIFDPRGKNRVRKNQYATYHEEYTPGYQGGQITTNCDDMAKVTLGEGNDMVAAMHSGEYGEGVRCGSCVLVEGPHSSTVVTIIDNCECDGPGSHLDLSPAAFRAVNDGNLADGIIPITWKTVSCSINQRKQLHYRFKEGSTKWWMQLSVVYNVDPIEKVEVRIDGRYYEMSMKNHGYWAFAKSTPPISTPMKIRITSTAGQVVRDELSRIEYSQSVLVKGNKGVQFEPKCPS